jgi:hypothetical protein
LQEKGLSHPFGESFVPLFSPELHGQPEFKFAKDIFVIRIYCMIPRMTGFLE